MGVDSTHPQYDDFRQKWLTLNDIYRGEEYVKDRREKYLPATSNMIANGMTSQEDDGYKEYSAYLMRAVFPEYYKEAVETFVGLMFTKDPTIELPAAMQPLINNASTNNETLQMFLRRVYIEQLSKGRCGIMADMPANPDISNPLPYLTLYDALQVRNWDDGTNTDVQSDNIAKLQFVILDESGLKREAGQFEWEIETRYRLLECGQDNVYRSGLYSDSTGYTYSEDNMIEPHVRAETSKEIPFVFINSKDILPNCQEPPLMQLATICLAIYRMSADYHRGLHLQGQDTLVITGSVVDKDSSDGVRTGSGAVINLEDPQSDAKYIGVNSNGLSEQREALADYHNRAEVMCGKLPSSRSGTQESGEALKIRIAAQTAMLGQIATTGAKGLEKILKIIAKWIGASPDEVIVIPNLEFTDYDLSGSNLLNLMQAIAAGAPISLESVHANLQKQGFTDMDFETEMKKVSKDGLQTSNETSNLSPNPVNNDDTISEKEVKS